MSFLRFYKKDGHKMMRFVNDYTGDIVEKIDNRPSQTYTRTQMSSLDEYWIDITQQWIKDIDKKRLGELY